MQLSSCVRWIKRGIEDRIMSAASKMGMRSYVSVVTLGSLMVSMGYPFVVLKIEGMSEAAGGAGIVWAFSVPSIVILSFIASKYTYRKYISSETIAQITGLYAANIFAVPVIGILITFSMLYLLG